MKIYKIILKTKAEGPGLRSCIWVQGCSHACTGCFATHLWDYKSGSDVSVGDVISQLQTVIADIDGITLLGGEPMDQAKDLWKIASFVKEQGKNVLTFTGYTYEQLLASPNEDIQLLLKYTDLLADGPFIESQLNYDRPLLGSSNQRFIYLTNAITEDEINNYHNSFEFRVDANGKISVNGMGNLQKLEKYLTKVGGRNHGITNI